MKDIQTMLRRLDEEITGSRQEIARQQVNIARLEDTRRVLMGLAEADQEAQAHRAADRQHVIPGSHARPVLVVRKTGTGEAMEDVSPLGVVASGKRKGLPRLRPGVKGRKHKVPGGTLMSDLRERVLRVVEPGEEPMSPKDIGNNIGLSTKEEDRKPLWNTLYQMRVKGMLERDSEGRYFRPAQAEAQQAAE